MNWVSRTQLVMVLSVMGLFAYDYFALVNGGYSASISYQFLKLASEYPIVAFAMGVLFGHLFWPNNLEWGEKQEKK